MKKYYLAKVPKEKSRLTERVIMNCLIDRYNICSLEKQIKTNEFPDHVYFIVGGESYSCELALSVAKRALEAENVSIQLYTYDKLKTEGLYELIFLKDFNSYGTTIKNYTRNIAIINRIKKLTTEYSLKKRFFSPHVFCPECDGFADAVELNSLKGSYNCSFCNADIFIEGPLLTGKAQCSHLSSKEQLYLIGLPSIEQNVDIGNANADFEQLSLIYLDESVAAENMVRRKRRPKVLIPLSLDSLATIIFEQLFLEL